MSRKLDGRDAVLYVVEKGIQGSFVECGVQDGRQQKIWLSTLNELNVSDREIWLYDTFSGLTAPTDKDFSGDKNSLKLSAKELYEMWAKHQSGDVNTWCYASLSTVQGNLAPFSYPADKIKYVAGDVIKTLDIEENIPEKISFLRLDTDWYESTKKEMEVLFPRLSSGGVLVLDDYFWWAGQKQAVNEYFNENNISFSIEQVGEHTGFMIKD